MPWFIEEARARTETEILIKLEDISSPEAARKFNQKTIWLTNEDFGKQASQSAPISFIGFLVVEDEKPIGVITEIIEQPHQVLCTVAIGSKEALIPLHQDSLLQIDRVKKQIHVTLPEGLLDLYLA